MKPVRILQQIGIILGIGFAGELLHAWIPIPIPAGIYGIVILLILLMAGIIKPETLKPTATILIGLMPIMFVPAVLGIMQDWDVLKSNLLSYLAVLTVTTVLVMGVTGVVTQWIIYRKEGKNRE